MNVLVFNPAARSGGALTVLNNFIRDVSSDFTNRYFIVISEEIKSNTVSRNHPNITYIIIKNGYYHRLKWLYFDIIKFNKTHNIDVILSLENIGNVFLKSIPQFIYLHQSLQFASSNLLSVKLIIKIKMINGLLIKYSCRKAAGIFVQTEWMSNAVVKVYKANKDKVSIVQPIVKTYSNNSNDINQEILTKVNKLRENGRYVGICVTNANSYKRLETIIRFVYKQNMSYENKPVSILFTISSCENEYAKSIYKLAEKLEIKDDVIFIGQLNVQTLHKLYGLCDAMFYSSAIETLGLPLIEAMEHNLKVFGPDLPYIRDVCNDYAFKYEFDNFESLKTTFNYYYDKTVPQKKEYKGESFLKIIEIIRKRELK